MHAFGHEDRSRPLPYFLSNALARYNAWCLKGQERCAKFRKIPLIGAQTRATQLVPKANKYINDQGNVSFHYCRLNYSSVCSC